MDSKSTSEIRERLLETTDDLIYRQGIQATGMDLVVKTSGVARKSIYKYFGTKDELVTEVLRRRDERWMNWFRTSVERAETPEARLLEIFTVLKDWFISEGFRGCAFINTAGEIGDSQDPVRLVAKEHKEKLLKFVRTICQEYGAADPDALARRFLILIEGAITVAHVLGESSSADDALHVARTLLGK
ncbi:TetR/AcrR family transcriptional regulator [Pseudomonas monteilii]|uniref:TetR/AcrR family transcriptional regulator n=1 Tax=Pseudomonas monteilii TaxID=76759 RepID=A0A399M975_9PSED|nr:TetR/AcrR family transcriptional regulator [Pseudomonas monteilii]RII77386.1 TetR/AcrR family transcriptional regulator [Pseudomonas monteilii]